MSRSGSLSWLLALLALSLGACGKVVDSTGTLRSPPGTSGTGGSSSVDDSGAGAAGASSAGTSGAAGNGNPNGGGNSGGSGNAAGARNSGGSPSTNDAGLPIGAGGTGGSGGVSDGAIDGSDGAGGAVGAPDVPPDILHQPTVWVGEVESAVSYPTVMGDDKGPETVTLVLDAITNSVTGTVSFGEGPQPTTDPSLIYPTWSDSSGTFPTIADNWLYSPFPGFPYTIVSSELKGNRLSLNFAPVEIYRAECTQLTPSPGVGGHCECSATECHSALQPIRRLDLVVTGSTMAGELTRPAGNWLGGVPGIRLTRIK